MSSHYIIRDDQSPAVLLQNLDDANNDLIFSLLEWQPSIYAMESTLGFVLHHRINLDGIILNQMSEKDVDELLSFQKPYNLISAKNFPTEFKSILKAKGIRSIDIVGHFDEEGVKIAKELESEFNVHIFSAHTKYVRPRAGIFSKWCSPGRGFIVFPVSTPINYSNAELIGPGQLRTIKEGTFEIRSDDAFWIGEIIK